MMNYRCATGLNVACANRNIYRLSIPGGIAPTLYDRVKAILPETVIFFPLSRNESQFLTFADYSLAGRVLFSGGMILPASGGCHRLCRDIRPDHDRYKKHAKYQNLTGGLPIHNAPST
jgi:hypothetical protein